MGRSALIGIDWGTTNLRAFRFGEEGEVLERRVSRQGISAVSDGGFEAVLEGVTAGWVDSATTIVMAGMVGSRNGWVEAPYLPCPADPESLAASVVAAPNRIGRCVIVPGLSISGSGRAADVMRGEETQLLGAGLSDGLAVLPGTHSKWATLEAGRIAAFTTAFTGELHGLLLRHSLLGRLAAERASPSPDAFARGARRSLEGGALPMTLFSARAEVLVGDLGEDEVASYLSGLLIGAEVAAANAGAATLTLIGDPVLCGLYGDALALAGAPAPHHIDGDAAVSAGLWAIGSRIR